MITLQQSVDLLTHGIPRRVLQDAQGTLWEPHQFLDTWSKCEDLDRAVALYIIEEHRRRTDARIAFIHPAGAHPSDPPLLTVVDLLDMDLFTAWLARTPEGRFFGLGGPLREARPSQAHAQEPTLLDAYCLDKIRCTFSLPQACWPKWLQVCERLQALLAQAGQSRVTRELLLALFAFIGELMSEQDDRQEWYE